MAHNRVAAATMREAACWAHLRRDFHDVWEATDSPIAREALERIGALHDIEATINSQSRAGPARCLPRPGCRGSLCRGLRQTQRTQVELRHHLATILAGTRLTAWPIRSRFGA